jgi:hypothetical protein
MGQDEDCRRGVFCSSAKAEDVQHTGRLCHSPPSSLSSRQATARVSAGPPDALVALDQDDMAPLCQTARAASTSSCARG